MIYIGNYQPERTGGGFTFANNFAKGMDNVTSNYAEADIYFVCGPTIVERAEVEKAKADGKKIVTRIDNAVRDSRNRNTGMSRMKDFCDWSDLVIYQSKWARDYLYPFTKKDGPVILNGVDQTVFKPATKQPGTYIYSRINRDETKGWEVARYWFSTSASPGARLTIVGNFSPELVDGKFDFYMGEDYKFYPNMGHADYAQLLAGMENFIYTYWMDACSNSLIEALACECEIVDPHHFLETGGAPEIIEQKDISLDRMINEYREALSVL